MNIIIVLLVIAFIGLFLLFVQIFVFNNGDVNGTVGDIQIGGDVLGISSAGDSNLQIPEDITYERDDALSDEIAQRVTDASNPGGSYDLQITRLGIENTVSHSNDIATFQSEAWLVLPWTYEYQDSWLRFPPWKERLPKSGPIVICYRRFFGKTNPKSCWKLDEIEKNDEILFDDEVYKVDSVTYRPKTQNTIFESDANGEFLKLITTSGAHGEPDLNSHYLIVLAHKEVLV